MQNNVSSSISTQTAQNVATLEQLIEQLCQKQQSLQIQMELLVQAMINPELPLENLLVLYKIYKKIIQSVDHSDQTAIALYCQPLERKYDEKIK